MWRFLWLVVCIACLLPSCQVGRYVIYNFADIKDYKKFPSRKIGNAADTFLFAKKPEGRAPKTITVKGKEMTFDAFLEKNKTVAFLIIRNDTINYERYFKGYEQPSIVPSFSMAKSVVSILIGCAIDDGLIKSENDPVTDYLPEMKAQGFEKVTIRHVLQMTSALKFNESYVNPFGDAASYYYGRHLHKKMAHASLKGEPGKQFEYVSGNTQLLSLLLEAVLKPKTVSQYLQEKLWQPLGMEYDASWSLDKKNGTEKGFCCINARARDFAKIGRLYLNKGNVNGKQIVSKSWVEQSTVADTTRGGVWYYKYQWWLPTKNGDFMAEGILGQFVYVNPTKNLIIVRLGKKEGSINWWELFPYLASRY
jgi:CubicO group peptidase (beta-lactamase class C family)